jgi:hypothetical protein
MPGEGRATFQPRPDRRRARAAQVPHLIGRPPPNRPRLRHWLPEFRDPGRRQAAHARPRPARWPAPTRRPRRPRARHAGRSTPGQCRQPAAPPAPWLTPQLGSGGRGRGVVLCFPFQGSPIFQSFQTRSDAILRKSLWRVSSFGQTCWRAAVEDLYETGQHRLHLIDLLLLARNYLTAKFLDFRILDGRPFTHENSSRMMRDHRR